MCGGRVLQPSRENMKIQNIYTKLIKPNSPTPQNLKNYKLSFLDTCLTPMNLALLLFYQSKPQQDSQLEESLAQILVQFYPLAGRYIKDEQLVDCSDQGAEFVRADALDAVLADLVETYDAEKLKLLYPDQYFGGDERASDPLLSIQATGFPCGGLVIAVSVSHRIFDIPAITTFITAWSEATNPDKSVRVTPTFDLPSLLPCKDNQFGVNFKGAGDGASNIVAKRLSFDRTALTNLQSRIKVNGNETVSGSCLVSAVIARALIGLDHDKHGKSRDFVIFQPINMRGKTVSPQSKHLCGNLTFTSLTRPTAASDDGDIGFQELVDVISDGIGKTVADLAHVLSPQKDGRAVIINSLDSLMQAVRNPETNFIVFSDCTEFGFYDTDFGWGKPVWASITPQRLRSNASVLMSNGEGDGIEAWVHLNREEMPYFEQHEEIRLFAF